MPSPIEQALSSLLPTLSPLPIELLELSTSLLAQSRARASTLKSEEEIGRTYACCHIACERLGKKLALEIGRPAPPVKPKVYAKLKGYLGSVLRTPVTPRTRRTEDKVGNATPKSATGSGLRQCGTPAATRFGAATPTSAVRRGLRSAEVMSSKSAAATPATTERKRKMNEVEGRVEEAEVSAPPLNGEAQEDVEMADADVDDEDEDAPPVKRPSKTPLRRKEKHAKRSEDGLEDLGAAGLLPGLGTMYQTAVDWLSDERRAEYAMWKKDIMKELAVVEQQMA